MKRIKFFNNSDTVIETNSIKTVLEYVDQQESMVVFDIDKTLAYTGQELGSEQWAFWLVKQKLSQGYALSEAIVAAVELYQQVHQHIELMPVEQETIAVVNRLKELSVPTLCLTGRPAAMADRTYRQLANLGLLFSYPQDCDQIVSLEDSGAAVFYKGIICVGMADKGSLFFQALQKLNFGSPKSIIFIDDKKECVDSLSLACKRNDIPFTGLRYGYLDQYERSFDALKAQEQLNRLLEKQL